MFHYHGIYNCSIARSSSKVHALFGISAVMTGKQSIYNRILKWIVFGAIKRCCSHSRTHTQADDYTGINQLDVNINFHYFFLIAFKYINWINMIKLMRGFVFNNTIYFDIFVSFFDNKSIILFYFHWFPFNAETPIE